MKNKLKITKVKPGDSQYGVRLYATVPSRSRLEVNHRVTYIRKDGMKRWLCTCEDQTFKQTGKRRNCDHIKYVRLKVGL